MTGMLFIAGTARRKSTGARNQVCRSMSGPTRRPSCAWLGVAWRRKSIGATSRGKRRFSKISWWAPSERKSVGATSQGYGAWGRAPRLGAQGLGPGPPAFLGCKGEKKRVFTLPVTETIQHAPQGRRILNPKPSHYMTRHFALFCCQVPKPTQHLGARGRKPRIYSAPR